MVAKFLKSKFELIVAVYGVILATFVCVSSLFYSAKTNKASIEKRLRGALENVLNRADLAFGDTDWKNIPTQQLVTRLNTMIRFQGSLTGAAVLDDLKGIWHHNTLNSEALFSNISSPSYDRFTWQEVKTKDLGEFAWAEEAGNPGSFHVRRPVSFDYQPNGYVYMSLEISSIVGEGLKKLKKAIFNPDSGGLCMSNPAQVVSGKTPCIFIQEGLRRADIKKSYPLFSVVYILCLVSGALIGLMWRKLFFEPRKWIKAISSTSADDADSIEENVLDEIRQKTPIYANLISSIRNSQRSRVHAQLAHDLRSPLAALSIISSRPSIALLEGNDILQQATSRLQQICDDVLSDEQRKRCANLINVVEAVLSEKRLTSPGIAFNLSLQIVGSSQVNVSESDLARLISNLLNNAIEHSAENSEIKIGVIETKKSIQLTIQDYGRGMTKKMLAGIGERYASSKSAKNPGGLGLGTTHAARVVKSAGGNIKWKSKIGLGTKVIIDLPRETVA